MVEVKRMTKVDHRVAKKAVEVETRASKRAREVVATTAQKTLVLDEPISRHVIHYPQRAVPSRAEEPVPRSRLRPAKLQHAAT